MPVVNISEFTKQVLKLIKAIPAGRVATYKQIAELALKPQGARGVAWILHSCSTTYDLPWHRVLNSQGKISFEPGSSQFREQKRRLIAEGVTLDKEGKLDLSNYRWKKKTPKRKSQKAAPKMFS